ncbi:hypothetical protein LJ739_02535 [Aestuariibacter halophilus]|uniref:Uncharacterized protein n=1 Tax=Fluctibacter halophilus TaxID=226011 RepID=A0ABS8G3G3_9ALTE|nr:hypothetical protein [Aestuariibacter halophilus]MCC2615119.1 hypothetical protein [Aestuariibacter halophilus]
MSKAIFIVGGPLHVINMQEAMDAFAVDEALCLVFHNPTFRGENNYRQTKAILRDMPNVEQLEYQNVAGTLEQRIAAYGQHIERLKAFDADRVFFNDARAQCQKDIVATLQKPTFLLDDGGASLITYHLYCQRHQYFNFPEVGTPERKALAMSIKQQWGISTEPQYPFDLFSYLTLPSVQGMKVVHNPLNRVKMSFDGLDQNTSLIIGSNFVGRGFLSEAQYITLVKAMVQGEQCIYLPHRGTPDSLLDALQRAIPGLTVVQADEPVESWLRKQKTPPATVRSFYSGAICTISVSFPQLNLICYRLPQQVMAYFDQQPPIGIADFSHSEAIEIAYHYFEQSVPVIDLEPLLENADV